MDKVIYENESGKLTANASGGVVTLTQELEGEVIGSVSMYYEDVQELNDFINSLNEPSLSIKRNRKERKRWQA